MSRLPCRMDNASGSPPFRSYLLVLLSSLAFTSMYFRHICNASTAVLGISLGNLVDDLLMKCHNLWRNHTVVTTTSRGATLDPSTRECKQGVRGAPGISRQISMCPQSTDAWAFPHNDATQGDSQQLIASRLTHVLPSHQDSLSAFFECSTF